LPIDVFEYRLFHAELQGRKASLNHKLCDGLHSLVSINAYENSFSSQFL